MVVQAFIQKKINFAIIQGKPSPLAVSPNVKSALVLWQKGTAFPKYKSCFPLEPPSSFPISLPQFPKIGFPILHLLHDLSSLAQINTPWILP